MPVMNGLELCREAYALNSRMKIVILSGYEEFEYARQALKYKAEQYLLKPLSREATCHLLAEVAEHFERVRSDESALRGLRALSDEAQKQVAKRFLQALIAGSQAEIGTLFPLTCRMKIPLFEGEGHLLLLAIDEVSLRDKRIGHQETSLFHYILNQIAAETAESCELVWTIFDDRERTVLLLSGTEIGDLLPGARDLYGKISENIRTATGLTLTGGLGARIEDVLQLEASYQTALAATYRRFRSGGNRLYEFGDGSELAADSVNALLQIVKGTFSDPYADKRLRGSTLLADLLPGPDGLSADSAFGFGAFLLRELERGPGKWQPEQWKRAWQTLESLLPADAPEQTLASAQEAYQAALNALQAPAASTEKPSDANEIRIVDEISRFIEENYAEPISLSMLSDKFQLSQQHISTAFHKHAGIPYIKYMTRIRMENAARLLSEYPQLKIFEIAERTGYANVKHFSYVFKKHFGMTPGEYPSR
jgi:two-component system response regulator YesN